MIKLNRVFLIKGSIFLHWFSVKMAFTEAGHAIISQNDRYDWK